MSFSGNPFFSAIDAMPDINPRKKSIPLVSELVLKVRLVVGCFKWPVVPNISRSKSDDGSYQTKFGPNFGDAASYGERRGAGKDAVAVVVVTRTVTPDISD